MPQQARRPAQPPPQVAAPQQERRPAGPGNGAAVDEFNVYVRGTFSKGADTPYFDPGMMRAGNEFMGAANSAEFDWFGGPNAGKAREIGGRKLLHEQVLPAFGRGEKVNLIGHSHGGNVIGEMSQYYGERMDYLSTLQCGIESGDPKSADFKAAMGCIADLRKRRTAELDGFRMPQPEDPEQAKNVPEFNPWYGEQPAYVQKELAEIASHERTLTTGKGKEAIAQELELLKGGDFGEVMALNTPWFAKHDDMTKQKAFMGKVDHIYDVRNKVDPVVSGAQMIDKASTLGPTNKMTSINWTLPDKEAPEKPGMFTVKASSDWGRAQHSHPIRSAGGFRNKVLNQINDPRHPQEKN